MNSTNKNISKKGKGLDILLINPFSFTRDGSTPYLPYGVLYLAGYLREKGFTVDIFDANADETDPVRIIEEKQPFAIGLSVLTGPVIDEALKISRETKKKFKDIKIIWGGLHPTLFPGYVLKEKSVDYIIQGEAEEALAFLMKSLLKGKFDKSIKNVGYREKGKQIVNPMSNKLLDLDDLPMPAWDLVDVPKYIANRFFASRVLTMATSRGCPFRCAYCFNQGLPYQKWRAISAKKIYEQLIHLKKRYKINGIQFYEDSFDTDKNRVKEFCKLMIKNKPGVKWHHFSNIIYCDEELLKLEREANCKYIEYGVESGSDRILKMINKAQNVEQIEKAFAICKKVGIKVGALFMIGYPTETMKELTETVDLIERVPAHIPICTIYRPYPGTPLHDYCVKEKGFHFPTSLDEQGEFYRFSHMTDEMENLSEVDTKYLIKLQKNYYAKFAINEMILCMRELNFGLLKQYIKLQMKPRALKYTMKSLLARFSLNLERRKNE